MISIIIPTYNRADLISETLDSLLSQSYSDWECILVDDHSVDDTSIIIQKYVTSDSRFHYYKRPDHFKKGPNSCRNYGFEKSAGNYIKWSDSDDILLPNALLQQHQLLAENTDAVVSKIVFYDFEKQQDIKLNTIFSTNLVADYLGGKLAFFVSGPLWKRSFLEKQNELFDESIRNMDDWDFNLRMLYQNPTIIFDDLPILRYRIHANSLSHEISKMNYSEIDSEILALEKHLDLVIKSKNRLHKKALLIWMKGRFQYFLRNSLLENRKATYFLKKLLAVQFELSDFVGIGKAITGFVSYRIFKKGYSLLK